MSETENLYELEVTRPKHLGGNIWKLQKLTPITIVLGRNGSGKSQLLRGIRDKNLDTNYYCAPERAGQTSFNIKYSQQEMDNKERASFSQGNSAPEYRQRIISRIHAFVSKIGNLDGVVEPKKIRSKVEEPINQLLSDFKFEITSGNIPYSLTRKSGEDETNTSERLSSGETQVFTLALDLVLLCEMWKLDKVDGLILIDEPDLHLHPELQQKFAEFISKLIDEYSYRTIIATHSTTFLAALGHFGGNKTSIIYLKKSENFVAVKFDKYLKTLANCLGGNALMGPLFGFPILLVEGDDELRIWSEVPRHNEVMLSVISCGGDEIKQYQKTLETLFSSLSDSPGEPRGYALLDGDKDIPQVDQEQIKFLKLSCHETENLYLPTEVLASMNLDWDKACKKVIENCENRGQKTSILKRIRETDPKTGDFKSIINELSWILDDKQVHWTLRIGQVLGKGKPQGQLKEFLGNELVNSIWKNSN